MVSTVPQEVLFIIFDFAIEDDSQYILVKYTSKRWRHDVLEWKKSKVIYSPRLEYQAGVRLGRGVSVNRFLGSITMLQWAIANGCRTILTSGLLNSTVTSGNLEVVKWLRERGCPWNESACTYAVWNNHIDILKWLRQQGCPWSTWVCEELAAKGNLEALKWCRRQRAPWDYRVCMAAALHGRLGVLKWLKSQKWEMGKNVATCASRNGHIKILKWLRKIECPWWNYRPTDIHPNTDRWLTARGFPGEQVLATYTEDDPIED